VNERAGAGLDDTLAALADPVRRRAVELLAQRPRRAGELAGELGATPSTMSKHLRVLRACGLVAETHPDFDARVRIYALRSAPMTELRRWLDTAERAWAEQLAAFAAHLGRDAAGALDAPVESDVIVDGRSVVEGDAAVEGGS
jgi:DNA-binding transcriptional ArsR family regulator